MAKNRSKLGMNDQTYRKMVEEVQDYAILLLDTEGHILNWNKGAEKIKQYNESDVLGQHFRMFYLPEDRAGKLPEILMKQAADYGRAIHEGWRMRKDRTRFWGSITLTALHDDDGKLIGFSKLTRDLTERKMAEEQLKNFTVELQLSNEALQKSEEQYHKMISEVQDYAIILLDVDGKIQNWNAGAEKIKGYAANEIIGKSFEVFYSPEDQLNGLPKSLLAKATLEGRAIHEGWRITKSGSTFWGSIVITALHDDLGRVIGFSKVTRDLTDKKIGEDKVKQYLFDLERQNKELDQFAYAASHDLQEPLRKIITFADMIEQSVSNEMDVRKYARKITESSQRMSELIRDILDYSRLNKDASHKMPTDLNTILAHVKEDFELMIMEKDARINAGPLPVITAIPMQVNQLFSNLIGNALKFTDHAPEINILSAIVEIESIENAPPHLSNQEYLELTFRDNGIGFEPRYGQLIFSLFQRLNGKQNYEGTGIGLALCKKVMENHDGWITAMGEPGKGATFTAYFPVTAI